MNGLSMSHPQTPRKVRIPPYPPMCHPNQDHSDIGDMSIATIQTVPDGTATETEPDGVVCHICVVNVEEPPDDSDARFAWDRRHGMKTNHVCFPAMLELKRGPSRCLRGGGLSRMRQQLLAAAEDDLQLYCSLQFARDQHASEVVTISGAGGWWRWVKFTRKEIPPYPLLKSFREQELDEISEEQYFEKYSSSFIKKFSAAAIHYLGSKESDAEWIRLREEGLIPVLEAHRTDYPRLFQPQAGPSGVADQAAESAAPAPAKTRRGKRADSPPAAGQTEANDAADRGVSSRRMTRAAAKQAKANQTGTSAQAGRPTREAQENQADPSGVANQAVEPLAAPTPATRRRAGGRRANSPRAAGQTEVSDVATGGASGSRPTRARAAHAGIRKQANENQPAAGTGAQAGRQARGNKARQAQARAHAQAQAGSSDDADAGMSRAGRDRKGKGRMRG